jgi:hypothetical protein
MARSFVCSKGKHALDNMTQHEQGKLLRLLGESSGEVRYELGELICLEEQEATSLFDSEGLLFAGKHV